MKRLRLTILGLVLTLALCASSATYFCSPNGNGNGNSYATPCSFSTGIGKLSQAGDTLYLLGGQYNLGNTQINKNGSTTKNIVISGYPGETAILDFRSTPYGTRGLQVKSTSSYLHIKNLTLRYSGKNNLYNEGSYCIFENLDIYGSADTGCQMKTGGNNLIKNVDSHDNFDYGNTGGSDLTFTNVDYGGNADGFADKQHSGAPNHYVGCRAWNNSDDGWDFFQRVTNSETIIENCICYKNGPAEYDMRNHGRYQTDKSFFDQFKNGKACTDRYGNTITITLEHFTNIGNGNGFKLGGGYTNHLVLVHHCLSVANTVKGFDQNNNDGTMRIYNNTGYRNGTDFGFTTAYGTLSIQNCISFQSRSTNATRSKTTVVNSHNSWSSGFSVSANDFVSIDTTHILDARQANGDYPQAITCLLALSQTSQFVDAGTNVGLPYMGSAPDLGWQESNGIIRPDLTITLGMQEQTLVAGDSISPVVITWAGCDTKPSSTTVAGIERKVSNNNKTLTFSGVISTPGTYTITTTTNCDSANTSLTLTFHVRPANLRRVAYVTTPSSAEDQAILQWLALSDSVIVCETDAADNRVDYSNYEMLILGSKPSSGTAGFAALKGFNKPMLVLKPFLFKNTVWNWGTAVNTQDLEVSVQDRDHAIFSNLSIDSDNKLKLFNRCTTNAVTGISDWTATTALASPASNSNVASIMDVAAGTTLGAGNSAITLPQRMVVIGVSEYSTADLTDEGLQLIENAIYYLLGLPIPTRNNTTDINEIRIQNPAEKIMRNGQIVIIRDGIEYSILGQRIDSK